MKYKWDNLGINIEIISKEEFMNKYKRIYTDGFLGNMNNNIHFCKVEYINDTYVGTIVIPKQKSFLSKKVYFGFSISDNSVTFFDDTNTVETNLDDMRKHEETDGESVEGFLFNFMDNIVSDDLIFLQRYHKRLTTLEEILLKKDIDRFDKELFKVRKDMLSLSTFYRQMFDMCEKLQQITTKKEDEKSAQLFGILGEKIERMDSMVQMLNDYSIRLREMHQTQIDLKQNEIMKMLTIITAIFLPLTLIAGWFGMNFEKMHGIKSELGYPIICVVAAIVVISEIVFLKHKKWF